jgi:hypothetical protein
VATYRPRPIDTSGIDLDPEIEGLVERLAENNHDLWARRRIEDGWRHGPRRDDARKEHPDLIPFGELPESEKEYDRQSVTETLRAVVALGYRFERR